jgi:hypothetical protein
MKHIIMPIMLVCLFSIQFCSQLFAQNDLERSNITQIGHWYETGERANKVFISDHYAYVTAGFSGLHILDISGPGSPQRIGACAFPEPARDVYVEGGYAYVTSGDWGVNRGGTKGLYIIDIRTPENPLITGFFKMNNAGLGLTVANNIAYVAEYWSGLLLIDISNPSSPQRISTIGMRHAEDVDVIGKYCYVLDRSSTDVGLRKVDISNPHSPLKVGYIECEGRRLYISDDYIYTIDSCIGVCSSRARLEIFSLDDETFGQQVGLFSLDAHPYDVFVSGHYAYIATNHGLQLIDTSMPSECQKVGYFETPSIEFSDGPCGGVAFSNDLIYLAAGGSGVYVLQNDLLTDINDNADQHLKDFCLMQNYPNPFNPTTDIDYDLPKAGHVRVAIYDALGRRIRTLVDIREQAGRFNISWDGKEERGMPVPGGLYFCHMQAGEFREVIKMLLVR